MTKGVHLLAPFELSLTRDLAFAFFEESKLPGKLDFTHWMTQWAKFMDMKLGAIFVYENGSDYLGMIGGLCVQCTMTGDMEAIEAFWYVKKEHRGTPVGIKLLKMFERWAISREAKRIKMMHLSDLNADMMRDIYLRMGYTPLEQAYSKNL